jgi:hypothetical protein
MSEAEERFNAIVSDIVSRIDLLVDMSTHLGFKTEKKSRVCRELLIKTIEQIKKNTKDDLDYLYSETLFLDRQIQNLNSELNSHLNLLYVNKVSPDICKNYKLQIKKILSDLSKTAVKSLR